MKKGTDTMNTLLLPFVHKQVPNIATSETKMYEYIAHLVHDALERHYLFFSLSQPLNESESRS